MKFPTRHPNLNALWSALLLDELWRLGGRHLCIAPGSRSAPLTLAAARHEGFEKHVHIDERGLAFYALGLAKSSGTPTGIIVTSGTAVANLYPAIIEARQSGVPLVVMTADRPPELIDCGANQAIEQQGIFAGYPGATVRLPTPNESIPASWVLTSLDQAYARSCQQGLPMHINCMFREPLYPDGNELDYSGYLVSVAQWLETRQPHTVYESQIECDHLSAPVPWSEFAQGYGLIVVGRLGIDEEAEAVLELSAALGWPILADIQSQLHGHPATIPYADLLLASRTGQELLRQADRIFQVGGHLISKRVDRLISTGQWRHYYMLGREFRRMDTGYCQTFRMVGSVKKVCRLIVGEAKTADISMGRWTDSLMGLGHQIGQAVAEWESQEEGLTEQWLGSTLTTQLPEGCGLFPGNSLPVRLLDMFSRAPAAGVFSNRGASGIDGLIATAAGCASGQKKPLVAVIGDVSFLHDLNSLMLVKSITVPLVIVLLNNDGGGIFKLLPIENPELNAQEQARAYFQTPHGLDAEHAARMFDLPYHCPESRTEFNAALQTALAHSGSSLIEVKTEPGEAASHIRQVTSLVEVL